MEQQKYIKAIIKKVKCSKKKKTEIKKQLESDINIALENGETLEMIYQRMGTPFEIAKDFNDNLSDMEKKDARRFKRFKIVGIIIGIIVILGLAGYLLLPRAKVIEDSSVFDKEIVEKQAKEIIRLLSEEDYETLQNKYAENTMKPYLTKDKIEEAMQTLGSDWGNFISCGNTYMTEVTQKEKKYAVVQLNAGYENISVTYTITFDEDMKIAGFYMK